MIGPRWLRRTPGEIAGQLVQITQHRAELAVFSEGAVLATVPMHATH
jgi:hypothetical protein